MSETAKTLDTGGGTLGRSADCDWVLPDSEQVLSRRHCEISFGHGRFLLTDTSANGVFVNGAGEPLGLNGTQELKHGDRFALGPYQFEARIVPDAPESATITTPPRGGSLDMDDLLGPGPFRSDQQLKWEDDLDPARDGDPFGLHRGDAGRNDDLARALNSDAEHPLRPSTDPTADWLGPATSDHSPGLNQAFPAPSIAGNPIPDDWDPGLVISDLGKGASPVGKDRREPGVEPEPGQPTQDAGSPPPQDWDLGSLIRSAATAGTGSAIDFAAAPVELPRSASATIPAQAAGGLVPPVSIPPAVAVGAPVAATGDPVETAFRAFLRGAQIELPETAADAAAYMFTAGQIFRTMVHGLRDVLQSRATLKNEFRVERTVLRAAENNPLKFSADLEEAIKAILQTRGRGYMPGPRAVEEGFHDLRIYQLAVVAAMQEALTELLAAFDPEALKKRLDKDSRFLGFLPGSGSRYWEAYEKRYREIAKDAENSFRGILGETFARAYEESSRKLNG